MPAAERPWKAPSKVTIRTFSGFPLWEKCLRTIFTAHSIASVPELVKNTVSAKVFSVRSCASFSWFGIR